MPGLRNEFRSTRLQIEQHHRSMFAGSLEIGPDLGICEAHPGICDRGQDSPARQWRSPLPPARFPARGVRLRLPFDLGDPLVEGTDPEPAESRGTGHAGVAHQAVTRKHLAPAPWQHGQCRRFGGGLGTGWTGTSRGGASWHGSRVPLNRLSRRWVTQTDPDPIRRRCMAAPGEAPRCAKRSSQSPPQ